MEQPAAPRSGLREHQVRVVIEATEPPVLNGAAAEVLLRILLAAAEPIATPDVKRPGPGPVRSDS
jgi:hypothetical protein